MSYASKTILNLNDTIEKMNSNDYKDRFIAECLQLQIRYGKLFDLLIKYKAGTLDFVPKCPYEVLETQLKAMGDYLKALYVRAEIEGIKV